MSLNLDKTGWKRVPLGEVAAASKDKVDPSDGSVERFIAGEHMDTDDLKIHRWGVTGEVDLGPAFHRGFRPGQVLFGSRRTYLRKVAVADFEGVCANTTFVVETKDEEVLLQEFLPFVMTAEPFHAFAIAESKGSVNPYVNWSDIERYEFNLPPLDEQKRIADLLWALEGHRGATTSLRLSADNTRTQVIEAFVSTVTGPSVRLGEVLDIVRGGSPRPINDYFTEEADGLNWIKIGDVPPDGKYIDATAQRIRREGLSKTRQVRPGDFLLSNSMSFGRPYIARIGGCIHDGWLALSDRRGRWRTDYLYYLLRSAAVQTQFRQGAGGSTVKNLNTGIVSRVEVVLPNLSDQDELLARLDRTNASVDALDADLASATTLRSSLLADIF